MNIIDLAKSAGIKTYWFSNQGFVSKHDTPISTIADKSDYKFFLKSEGYGSRKTSDFMLLDFVKEVIKKRHEKKLIVVHLYGSHPNACDRIDDYHRIVEVNDKKYHYLNCYISSINKTDDFFKRTPSNYGKQ